jgi:ATP-binding cassette subfamily C protein
VKLIRQLWYILSLRELIEGAVLLCAMAVGALLEVIGIGLIIPFIAVLREPQMALNAPFAQPLLSFLQIHDSQELMIALGLGLVGAFAVKSGYLVLLNRWLYGYVFETYIRLARQLLAGYLNAPYSFHLQRNSAEVIKVATQTVQRFTVGFLTGLLVVLGELLVVAALVILLLFVDPLATVGAVLVLGVPTALIYRFIHHRLADSGRVAEHSMSSMIQWTEQSISGVKETLVTGRASFFLDRQCRYVRDLAHSLRSLMFLSAIPRLVIDTLAVTAMVAIALVILARDQDVQSILTVLGVFGMAAMRLMPSATRISNRLAELRFHYAATEVIFNELRATHGERPAAARGLPSGPPAAPMPFERSLALEHLSYHYPSMPRPAIDNISLDIPKGHWVGLVGPTGAGKTTLVDLMLGLFVPTSGRILVDGRDLQSDVAGWQRNIGYVPQLVYLIDDTVRRNVAFGLPDSEIDDERVWRALRAARVDQLVRSLPSELDAVIGERGDRLSGGERQRLGIARALFRDPAVLVVDEGTANLDNETEAAVVRTLEALKGEKTIITITHRLSSIRDCDRVYLLWQGQVRNSGAFADLVTLDPAFREFAGAVS